MWPTMPKITYCLAPKKCLPTAGLQAKANKESIKEYKYLGWHQTSPKNIQRKAAI